MRLKMITRGVAIAYSLFIFYVAAYSRPLEILQQRAIFFGFTAILMILVAYERTSKRKMGILGWWPVLPITIIIASVVNVCLNQEAYMTYNAPFPPYEIALAVLTILIALVLSRKLAGWVFIVLFIAVWLPCCFSDIVFPVLFVHSPQAVGCRHAMHTEAGQ